MKLKNRKTGVIGELMYEPDKEYHFIVRPKNALAYHRYKKLEDLYKEWEDYKEPKKYWYIEPDGAIMQNHEPTYINHVLDGLKSIGNYFETKEEVEKARWKLQAWKRLKDKGFKFEDADIALKDISSGAQCDLCINAVMPADAYTDKEVGRDLDICFGGEE